MKSIKMLLLAVAITFSSVLSASTAPKNAQTKSIESDVAKRLEKPTFILAKDVLTNVTLTVNKDNELVVLYVDSDNEIVVEYIKKRLNYTKVSVPMFNNNKTFIVPVRLAIEE